MEREEILSRMIGGLDCGQLTASAFSEELGLPEERIQMLTSAFGGGMYSGDTCGAVNGALIVLGALFGFSEPFSLSDKDKIREKTLEFRRRFAEKHGSCICREILGADCGTPEGMAEIMEKGLLNTVCPAVVADAIEIVEELIDED